MLISIFPEIRCLVRTDSTVVRTGGKREKEICKWPNQNLFFLICRWSRKRKIKHKFQGQASSRSPVSAKTDAFTFVLDSARTLRLHLATLLQSGYSLGCIRTAFSLFTIRLFGCCSWHAKLQCVRKVFSEQSVGKFSGAMFSKLLTEQNSVCSLNIPDSSVGLSINSVFDW